jgi:hypothetical protein
VLMIPAGVIAREIGNAATGLCVCCTARLIFAIFS